MADAYDALAEVYDWFVPDALLSPQGAAEAIADVISDLAPGARILDCAAGTGRLAVGLALRGFDVVATDASLRMVQRTRDLAAAHDVALEVVRLPWDRLPGAGWEDGFAAVLCIGNSITHAAGPAARRAALAAMADVLAPGGRLVLTSRNWELVRDLGSRLDVDEQLVTRAGRSGLPVRVWTIAEEWDDRHELDTAVALFGDGGAVETIGERLAFWPFSHESLQEDLAAAGLQAATSTYAADAERYLVTARRPG